MSTGNSLNQRAIERTLARLLVNLASPLAGVVLTGGDVLLWQGERAESDVAGLAQLCAQAFESNNELRTQLGQPAMCFLFQQGVQESIVVMQVQGRWLLFVIFAKTRQLRDVRPYVQQTVAELEPLLPLSYD